MTGEMRGVPVLRRHRASTVRTGRPRWVIGGTVIAVTLSVVLADWGSPTLSSAGTPTASAASATPAAAPVPPQSDPFYRPPAGYASTAPGTILASRPVQVAAFGTLPQKVHAWQLLYRSTDYLGRPEATVTTVFEPAGATSKPRGLVSYQIAEDAVAPQCAPSYQLRQGVGPDEGVNQAELLLIDAVVAEGFAVSIPDYEGPHGNFGAPREPGYAVLDGIRAAEQFAPLTLDGGGTPVGIWGYSGGSLASGWAAQVQRSYAPALNLRGVAVGGFVTDIPQALLQINGGVAAGLIPSVLGGVERTSRAIAQGIGTYATPAGKALIASGASQCEVPNVTEHPFLNLNNYLTIPLTQLMAQPSIQAAFQSMDLGSVTPTAPLFVYHAVNDELIPIAGVDATVRNYCAHGGSVTYTRDMASEHASLALTGAPAALSWLTQRLSGDAVPRGCTTTTVPTMLIEPGPALPSFLLGDLAGLLDQPIGPTSYF